MQCPRCSEEVAPNSRECPVCHKPLSALAQANVRVALTGEAYEADADSNNRLAVASSEQPPSLVPQTEAPELRPPIKLIPAQPNLFPTPPRVAAPRRIPASRENLLWLIVAFAMAGVLASAVLWYRPYVAPVQIAMQTTAPGELLLTADYERPIPAVYLWLWGGYCVLAVATQFFLPAPWRAGPFRMRTNWVLTATTVATLFIFVGTNVGQQGEGILQRETLTVQEGGQYTYQNGANTRMVSAEEARQINVRRIHDQEAAIYKVWNMAALLSYLALGAYAVWWIIERPEAEAIGREVDPMWLVLRAKGELAPENERTHPETMPTENTRSRDPASGDISWR